MKNGMKKIMLAAAALIVAAAVLIPAASAAVGYTIELEGGDFNVDANTYDAYVVLTGANGQYVGTQTLELTSNDTGITFSDIALGKDITGKFLMNGNKFMIYDGGKVTEDNAKVAKFTVHIGTLATTSPNLGVTVSEITTGETKSAQTDVTTSATVTPRVLSATAAHTLIVDGGAITAAVEDKKVLSEITLKVYSEQGKELASLTGINFKIAQAADADKLVEIYEDGGYFNALYAVNAGEDANATVAIYDSDDKKLDEKTITLTVTPKTDLAAGTATDVFAIPEKTSFPYSGGSVRDLVFAEIVQKNHNVGATGFADGFERNYGASFDSSCLVFEGSLTDDEPVYGGTYTFKINVPEGTNYTFGGAAGEFTDTTYTFVVTGEINPSFVMNNNKAVAGHFNAVNKANITMTYHSDDAELFGNFVKLDSLVPKYVTNPAITDGASIQLDLVTAPSGYTKGTDYTYDKATQTELKFLGTKANMQAQDEVFVFESAYCLGDVNQDGKVSGADATVICNKILSETPNWTAEEIFYGKTAGGVFTPTVLDAINIAKYPLGLVDADFNPV